MRKNWFQKLEFIFRVYVVIFGILLFVTHTIGIIIPGFAKSEPPFPTRIDAFFHSLPFLIYAIFLIFSAKILSRGNLFYLSLCVFGIGVCYWLYSSIPIIMKASPKIIGALIVLPFYVIPAFLALLLLIMRRKQGAV
ncbi:MAG: hypothetical protein ISS45_13540 [Candidatus Omnitrophica bacterium]|nr:hypothetical protein [Candidatus Omnitrophota bacterium]